MSAETTSPGGTAYLAPSHLAEVAALRGIADIQLASGQTLTNSIQNVAEGKTDISAAPFILGFLMSRGLGPYGALGPEKGAELAGNLRVLYPYALGIFILYAYDAKGVDGWHDLEGRKIFNGPPRGGALNNARSIITLVTGLKDGEGYEGVQANWGQSRIHNIERRGRCRGSSGILPGIQARHHCILGKGDSLVYSQG